jgi:hypothetical protein
MYRGLKHNVLANDLQGTLIGTIVDWATAKRPDKSSYLIPLGLIYVVPLLLAVGMLVSCPLYFTDHRLMTRSKSLYLSLRGG